MLLLHGAIISERTVELGGCLEIMMLRGRCWELPGIPDAIGAVVYFCAGHHIQFQFSRDGENEVVHSCMVKLVRNSWFAADLDTRQ